MKFKDKAWVIISFLTVITALVWLGVTIRSTLTKPTLPSDLEQISKPLNPNLDMEVFDNLKNRG